METFSPVFVEPEKSSSSPELPRLPYRHSSTASGMSDSIAGGIQQDDEVWTRYLAVASIVDSRMIDDWTKIIDVILVYVRPPLYARPPFTSMRILGCSIQWCSHRVYHRDINRVRERPSGHHKRPSCHYLQATGRSLNPVRRPSGFL